MSRCELRWKTRPYLCWQKSSAWSATSLPRCMDDQDQGKGENEKGKMARCVDRTVLEVCFFPFAFFLLPSQWHRFGSKSKGHRYQRHHRQAFCRGRCCAAETRARDVGSGAHQERRQRQFQFHTG